MDSRYIFPAVAVALFVGLTYESLSILKYHPLQ